MKPSLIILPAYVLSLGQILKRVEIDPPLTLT